MKTFISTRKRPAMYPDEMERVRSSDQADLDLADSPLGDSHLPVPGRRGPIPGGGQGLGHASNVATVIAAAIINSAVITHSVIVTVVVAISVLVAALAGK
jgi:hypothetical protein